MGDRQGGIVGMISIKKGMSYCDGVTLGYQTKCVPKRNDTTDK